MNKSENLCRICVKEKSPMISILEDNPLNLQEKLLKLLKIKVFDKSKLPKQICLECLTKLNNFNEFYVQSSENQVILQVLFSEKSEIAEIVTPKKLKDTSEITTQTDLSLPSEERYFIIEELTEGNDNQEISIDDELSREAADNESHYDIKIKEDKTVIKNEDSFTITDISITSFNTSKKRNRFDRFDCYICRQQLRGNFSFLKHFASLHPKDEIRYQCYICNNFVKKYRSYTRHLDGHTEKRFECDICNQKFSQKITLMTHLSTHLNIKKFECSECNLSFKQNSSLFKHKKQKHSNIMPTCEECNRSFVNKETYSQHLKSKHNTAKDISCDDCDKKFASKSALTYHKLSNHSKDDNSSVKCSGCAEEFKNKIILARHKKKCIKFVIQHDKK